MSTEPVSVKQRLAPVWHTFTDILAYSPDGTVAVAWQQPVEIMDMMQKTRAHIFYIWLLEHYDHPRFVQPMPAHSCNVQVTKGVAGDCVTVSCSFCHHDDDIETILLRNGVKDEMSARVHPNAAAVLLYIEAACTDAAWERITDD
jgi:hypothetical protein